MSNDEYDHIKVCTKMNLASVIEGTSIHLDDDLVDLESRLRSRAVGSRNKLFFEHILNYNVLFILILSIFSFCWLKL